MAAEIPGKEHQQTPIRLIPLSSDAVFSEEVLQVLRNPNSPATELQTMRQRNFVLSEAVKRFIGLYSTIFEKKFDREKYELGIGLYYTALQNEARLHKTNVPEITNADVGLFYNDLFESDNLRTQIEKIDELLLQAIPDQTIISDSERRKIFEKLIDENKETVEALNNSMKKKLLEKDKSFPQDEPALSDMLEEVASPNPLGGGVHWALRLAMIDMHHLFKGHYELVDLHQMVDQPDQ